jgi:hypothetical protein
MPFLGKQTEKIKHLHADNLEVKRKVGSFQTV